METFENLHDRFLRIPAQNRAETLHSELHDGRGGLGWQAVHDSPAGSPAFLVPGLCPKAGDIKAAARPSLRRLDSLERVPSATALARRRAMLEPPQPASKGTKKRPRAIQLARTFPFKHMANPLAGTHRFPND